MSRWERTATLTRLREACGGILTDAYIFANDIVDSTNRLAMDRGKAGLGNAVFIANEQTAGRGRGGHVWHSASGDGLYLSVLLHPRMQAADALKLSLAAGLAAQRAIQTAVGLHIDIRWPNDLVVPSSNNRKCGGILTETATQPNGNLSYAVIGIGINVNHLEMPEALQTISTSLRIASGFPVDRDEIAVQLVRELSAEIEQVEKDPQSVLPRFAQASSWVHGKRVSVAEDEGYTGITDGLSATGLLRVRCEDGSLREVRHGGVREA